MKKEKDCDVQTFYKCNVCGNVMIKLTDSGLTPQCCGRDMEKMIPNEKDAIIEKHVPYVKCDGNKLNIQIGETLHPMSADHYIEWIFVKTSKSSYIRYLSPECEPTACFKICKDEKPVAVYEYCNIHGLWEYKVEESDCEQ